LIGMAAGFVATVVMSAFMLMKDAIGLVPQFSMIGMISGMMNVSHAMGRVVQFMVATVLYGGALGWLLATTMLVPMAGNGFFGIKLGGMVSVMSLIMHLVFGVVLGWTYGWMVSWSARLSSRNPPGGRNARRPRSAASPERRHV
jgi:hypothetical protein